MADVDLDAVEQNVLNTCDLNDCDDVTAVFAELRRLRVQACDQCRHNRPRNMGHFTHDEYCYLHARPCHVFRGGCRAHEPKVRT